MSSAIHERLYQEKDRYFEKKNFINMSRDEEELKACTFKPNIASLAAKSVAE